MLTGRSAEQSPSIARRPEGAPVSRIRSMVVALSVAALTAVTVVVQAPAQAAPFVAAVEDEGADCAVPALPDAGRCRQREAPRPVQGAGRHAHRHQGDWRCQREEIKRQAEKFVYGEKPGRPASVTGTVSSTSITVNATHKAGAPASPRASSCPAAPDRSRRSSCTAGSARTPPPSGRPAPPSSATTRTPSDKEGTARTNKQGAFYSLYGARAARPPDGVVVGRQPDHRRHRAVRREYPQGRRDRRDRLLAVRQGRLRRSALSTSASP